MKDTMLILRWHLLSHKKEKKEWRAVGGKRIVMTVTDDRQTAVDERFPVGQ